MTRQRPSQASLVFALLALVFLGFPATAGGRKPPKEEGRDKPRLKLVAEPAVGFTPVTTILTAHLTGVAPDDPNFCHPAVTWVRINPGQVEDEASRFHEDPACRHPEEQVEATTSFVKTFDLYQPGAYLFRIIVEGKDRRRVESATTQVMVLRVQ